MSASNKFERDIKGWKKSYYNGKKIKVDIPEVGIVDFEFFDKSGPTSMMLGDIDLMYKESIPYTLCHMPTRNGGIFYDLYDSNYCGTIEISELALLQYPDGTKFIFWDESSGTQNEVTIRGRESTDDGGFIFNIMHKISSLKLRGSSSYKIKIMSSNYDMKRMFDDIDLDFEQLLKLKVGDIIHIKPCSKYYIGNPDPHDAEVIYKDIEIMVTKNEYNGNKFYDIYFLNYGYNIIILPK